MEPVDFGGRAAPPLVASVGARPFRARGGVGGPGRPYPAFESADLQRNRRRRRLPTRGGSQRGAGGWYHHQPDHFLRQD